MKTLSTIYSTTLLAFIVLATSLMLSCQVKNTPPDDPQKGFSPEIKKIVPEAIVADLRQRGMIIHEGKVPPKIDGIYRASPLTLVSPHSPDDHWQVGKIIDDGSYRFYQQTTGNSVTYDYKYGNGSNIGIGQGALIAGNGNYFTVFSEESGTTTTNTASIPYKALAIISGELTATGIRNFHYAFIIKEKTGDTNNQVIIPVNAGRIWKDGNQLADITSSFRLAAGTHANQSTPLSSQ